MNILDNFHESWKPIIPLLFMDEMEELNRQILPNCRYLPERHDIFRVFSMPVQDIKVVILGQDPYPNIGVPNGRAFAVSEGTKTPVSLRIIKEELKNSFWMGNNYAEAERNPKWNTLDHWDKQGVFLLNSALTVEAGKAGSHLKYWEDFIKRVITYIAGQNPCIWILWGKKAQEKRIYIPSSTLYVHGYDRETIKEIPAMQDCNYILQAPHPAAEAYAGGKAGFYGCDHFHFTNEILKKNRKEPILW